LGLLAKIHIVILSEAKNLLFSFSNQKIKRGDPSDLHPQDYKESEKVEVIHEFSVHIVP